MKPVDWPKVTMTINVPYQTVLLSGNEALENNMGDYKEGDNKLTPVQRKSVTTESKNAKE